MGIDVFQHQLDLGVVGGLMELFQLICHKGTVQQYHKFNKKNFCVQLIGKALSLVHLFNFFHVKKQIMLGALWHVHYTGAFLGPQKAAGKVNFSLIPLLILPVGEKVLGNVDNNTFI